MTTPHSLLKAAALKAAQRACLDVTFHNNVTGTFIPVHAVKAALGLIKAGNVGAGTDALTRAPRVTVNVTGTLDTRFEFVGGRSGYAEWKVGGDSLSPEQVAECKRLTLLRIPHIVVHARDVADIPRCAAEFAAWVVSVQRG